MREHTPFEPSALMSLKAWDVVSVVAPVLSLLGCLVTLGVSIWKDWTQDEPFFAFDILLVWGGVFLAFSALAAIYWVFLRRRLIGRQ